MNIDILKILIKTIGNTESTKIVKIWHSNSQSGVNEMKNTTYLAIIL